jgi:hypothetical protein
MFKSVKTGILAAILISTALIANAQKKISEGTVTYVMKSSEGEVDQKIKFNGDVSKMEIDGGAYTVNIFNDVKEGTGLVLVSVPVQQMQKAAKMSKEDVDKQMAATGNGKISDLNATGEKQIIAGYNAEKHTFKSESGETYEIWITKEVELPLNLITAEFKNVKGSIVKFTGKTGTVTLKSISEDKVGELSVSKIPSGYEEVTYAEMQAMQGGGE